MSDRSTSPEVLYIKEEDEEVDIVSDATDTLATVSGPDQRIWRQGVNQNNNDLTKEESGTKPFVMTDRGTFPRYYECGVCRLRMRSHQGLHKHFTSHGKQNLPENPAVCALCQAQRRDAFQLDQHVRLSHAEARAELASRGRAERRAKTRHVCPDCGKSLAKKDSLMEHMRIHTGEKPYECEHCNAAFRSWPMYWEHMRRHRGMKYKCTTCKAEFKDQYYLQLHSCSLDVMLGE